MNNQLAAELLAPFWKRAIVRCRSGTDSTTSAWFGKINTLMQMPGNNNGEDDDVINSNNNKNVGIIRAYHNVNHVRELCQFYDTYILPAFKQQQQQRILPDDDVVFLTAFFHDIIYDSTRGDNEERSADLFCEFASESGLPPSVSGPVRRITLATKKHLEWKPEHVVAAVMQNSGRSGAAELSSTAASSEQQLKDDIEREILNTKVFLDMDLAILGADEERYAAYSSQIRTEYRFVKDEDFFKGRGAFLQGMKKNGTACLFHTDVVRDLRAAQAERNLAWESEMLAEKAKALATAKKD